MKHYGRKGMKWDKSIFGKDDAPGQKRSSSATGGAQSKKALSSALSSRVSGGKTPETTLKENKIHENVLRETTLKENKIYEDVLRETTPKSGGRVEAKPRSGLQKWFDQAGKDIGNTFNSAKKGVEGAANSVKKWGEGAVNDTKKWVEGAANDTKKWTDTAIKDIGKTAVKIGDDAKKAYGDAEKWVNGAIKDVGNAAVKVGDDAKKAYGDAKTFVDSLLRGEKAADYVDGRTGKVVKGEGYLPGKIEKAFNSAKDSVSRTAANIADELVYGTKYAVGTARTAVKNAAGKVKDAYERATDTGTQRLLNPKHMTSRQKQAIWSKKSTKQGIEENLKKGFGPGVSSYDAFKAIDKKTGGKGYDVVARSSQTREDLAKLKINSAPPQSRVLASKRTPKVKFAGPSMADAKKYLSPSDLANYNRGLNYIAKYGEGDGSIKKELDSYRKKVALEKSFERNK